MVCTAKDRELQRKRIEILDLEFLCQREEEAIDSSQDVNTGYRMTPTWILKQATSAKDEL
jgi:hypothetical protein